MEHQEQWMYDFCLVSFAPQTTEFLQLKGRACVQKAHGAIVVNNIQRKHPEVSPLTMLSVTHIAATRHNNWLVGVLLQSAVR
eukprot:6458369-Amphidinium_carterae.1